MNLLTVISEALDDFNILKNVTKDLIDDLLEDEIIHTITDCFTEVIE